MEKPCTEPAWTYQVLVGETLDLFERLDVPEPLLDFGRIMVELGSDGREVDDPRSWSLLQQG